MRKEKANHAIPHRKFVDVVMRTAAEIDRNQGAVFFSIFLVPMKPPLVQKERGICFLIYVVCLV